MSSCIYKIYLYRRALVDGVCMAINLNIMLLRRKRFGRPTTAFGSNMVFCPSSADKKWVGQVDTAIESTCGARSYMLTSTPAGLAAVRGSVSKDTV